MNEAVTVSMGSGRTGGIKVKVSQAGGFFLKRAAHPGDQDAVQREANIYDWFASQSEPPNTPHCYGYDTRNGILILALDPSARSMDDYYFGLDTYPPEPSSLAALSIARLHRIPWTRKTGSGMRLHVRRLLELAELDLAWYRSASLSLIECLRIIQRDPSLSQHLWELRETWSESHTIHGDLRWSNVLVADQHVSLIDWESASLGDPCWDTGCFLANFFSNWVGKGGVSEILVEMGPAIRSFWRTYVKLMDLSETEAHNWLIKTMQFAGVRLVQSTLEMTRFANGLGNRDYIQLQLAANLLESPSEASTNLLGLYC